MEIAEVQAAMNMNNFLINDKDKWLTPELLKKISENPILAKLFTNPEYLNVNFPLKFIKQTKLIQGHDLIAKRSKGNHGKIREKPRIYASFPRILQNDGDSFQ